MRALALAAGLALSAAQVPSYQPYAIRTLAGGIGDTYVDSTTGSSAEFNSIKGVAVSPDETAVYVGEFRNLSGANGLRQYRSRTAGAAD